MTHASRSEFRVRDHSQSVSITPIEHTHVQVPTTRVRSLSFQKRNENGTYKGRYLIFVPRVRLGSVRPPERPNALQYLPPAYLIILKPKLKMLLDGMQNSLCAPFRSIVNHGDMPN